MATMNSVSESRLDDNALAALRLLAGGSRVNHHPRTRNETAPNANGEVHLNGRMLRVLPGLVAIGTTLFSKRTLEVLQERGFVTDDYRVMSATHAN